MKSIIKFAFAALITAALACCTDSAPVPGTDPEPTPGQGEEPGQVLKDDIKFTIEVSDLTDVSAKVHVSHDGTSNDRWFAFATCKDIDEAVEEKLNELTAENTVNGLNDETELDFNLILLYPDEKYTFVAFAITQNGKIYGERSITEFTTKEGFLKRNKNWEIEYTGKQGDTEHTATLTSQDNKTFIIVGATRKGLEEVGVEVVVKDHLESVKKDFNEYNAALGYVFKFEQLLQVGSCVEPLMLWPDDWHVIVYEVVNQEFTGYYSMTDMFTVEQKKASEAYSSWIGDWTFTGSNGVAWDVTIEQDYINESYLLSGWEGYDVSNTIEIPMLWENEVEIWKIESCSYGKVNFADGSIGEIFLYPAAIDAKGKATVFTNTGVIIGYGEDINGVKTFYTEPVTTEDGDVITLTHMVYMALINGSYYPLSKVEEWPSFPITITTREASKTAPMKTSAKFLAPTEVNNIEYSQKLIK